MLSNVRNLTASGIHSLGASSWRSLAGRSRSLRAYHTSHFPTSPLRGAANPPEDDEQESWIRIERRGNKGNLQSDRNKNCNDNDGSRSEECFAAHFNRAGPASPSSLGFFASLFIRPPSKVSTAAKESLSSNQSPKSPSSSSSLSSTSSSSSLSTSISSPFSLITFLPREQNAETRVQDNDEQSAGAEKKSDNPASGSVHAASPQLRGSKDNQTRGETRNFLAEEYSQRLNRAMNSLQNESGAGHARSADHSMDENESNRRMDMRFPPFMAMDGLLDARVSAAAAGLSNPASTASGGAQIDSDEGNSLWQKVEEVRRQRQQQQHQQIQHRSLQGSILKMRHAIGLDKRHAAKQGAGSARIGSGGSGSGAGTGDGPRLRMSRNRALSQSTSGLNKNHISVRYTEFDEHGNMKVSSGELLKTEICAKHHIQPRDLRKLDPGFTQQLPSILVRPTTILVNLYYVRAIIKNNHVVLLDAFDGIDYEERSFFLAALRERLRVGSTGILGEQLPYEFRALEAILEFVTNLIRADLEEVRPKIEVLLETMEENVTKSQLKEILILTKELSRLTARTKDIHDAISDVLSNDDDLAGMYLTDYASGKVHEIDDHQEVELLLESYLQRTDETSAGLSELSQSMRATEDFHQALLDYKRNSFLLLEINLAVATLSATWASMLAGFLGMNVPNPLEHSPAALPLIAGGVLIAHGLLYLALRSGISRMFQGMSSMKSVPSVTHRRLPFD